jgi:hypothetical protein
MDMYLTHVISEPERAGLGGPDRPGDRSDSDRRGRSVVSQVSKTV